MSISIPTTMKFRVRGKSVDFKNREGSSPSIPKKKTIWFLNYLSLSLFCLFCYRFKIRYVFYSFSSFTKVCKRIFFSITTCLVLYMLHVQKNLIFARNRHLNDSQSIISLLVLKLTKSFFENPRKTWAWVRLFIPFSSFY